GAVGDGGRGGPEDDRGTSDRRHLNHHRGRRGQRAVGPLGLVGERVGADKTRRGGVGKRTVRVENHSPVGGSAWRGCRDRAGVGVSPNRTCTPTLVPAGSAAIHDAVPQAVEAPASKTRETNVPAAEYGVIRSQSTLTAPAPAWKSSTTGRMSDVTAIGWNATC